jgi:hypothetical protein
MPQDGATHHIEYHEDSRMDPASKTIQVDSPAVRRLDGVRMSETDRAVAKRQMRQAERAIDLIVALARFVQSTAGRLKGRLLRRATAFPDGT